MVGVSNVEDLISTDVLEFIVTSADGQEYTFNNVATYGVDGTTPATLTSLGDAETVVDVVATTSTTVSASPREVNVAGVVPSTPYVATLLKVYS